MKSISITKARKDLGNIFKEVNYLKTRVILTNHKKFVAIIPFEDLKKLEAIEKAEDINEARLALLKIEKQGSISLEEMKKRLGP